MAVLKHPKHEQFAHLVAKGASATEAYICVGYSEKGAHASAHRLLRNAEVSARVAELQEAIARPSIERAMLDRTWVVEGLKRIAQKAEDKQEFTPAIKAHELLGKELGMFIDRKDMTVRAAKLDEIPEDELLAAATEAGLGIAEGLDTRSSSVH